MTNNNDQTISSSLSQQQALTVEQAFELATQHQQNNNLPKAEQLIRQLLQHQPRHALALHLLGIIAHSQTRRSWR
jgi:Tfp pilus assembly protein PilF